MKFRKSAASAEGAGPKKGVGRRRLLGRIGATGLAASAGVFAGTQEAAAAPACCNLANWPENTTYSYCKSHAAYIWYCESSTGALHCACCETAGNRLSAAQCLHS
ncbi:MULTISPECIES: hypothetical protein [Streptomyces]|uniref:hypothetical protein n=1 Tax=Streptomyces TaxID=1883 RepID=UPI000CF2916D|nr:MULTISPECIES: hypothetical protein [Streptomyces]PPS68131.1 hypothetical protein BV882_33590 [Streptomyces sp. 46]